MEREGQLLNNLKNFNSCQDTCYETCFPAPATHLIIKTDLIKIKRNVWVSTKDISLLPLWRRRTCEPVALILLLFFWVQVRLDIDVAPDHHFLSLPLYLRLSFSAQVSPFQCLLHLIPWKLDDAEMEIHSGSERVSACVHLKSVSPVVI